MAEQANHNNPVKKNGGANVLKMNVPLLFVLGLLIMFVGYIWTDQRETIASLRSDISVIKEMKAERVELDKKIDSKEFQIFWNTVCEQISSLKEEISKQNEQTRGDLQRLNDKVDRLLIEKGYAR